MSDLDLDPKQENLNKLGIGLCESHISYVVRNDSESFGEMAIENYIENYDEKHEEHKLTEADMNYLSDNSLLFMFKAMKNLHL